MWIAVGEVARTWNILIRRTTKQEGLSPDRIPLDIALYAAELIELPRGQELGGKNFN